MAREAADGQLTAGEAGERPSCATEHDVRSVRELFRRVGDKWSLQVVSELRDGPVRFMVLLDRIDGISHRLLAKTLKSLERDGLVTRLAYPEVPPRVEYALTSLGESLLEPISALAAWAERHRPEVDARRAQYDARNSPIAPAPAPPGEAAAKPHPAATPAARPTPAGHRILVVDRGHVVEAGSHEELLSGNGLYASLWRAERSQEPA
ncbi:winged helix-turn-helix transcriptional regulator [Frankia nepalensis]|uniref:winged helix-turn-helix transcriptional regulator n=1 Tax=Frankia nepalensis TaxID=1836974 RepID=UPI001EE49EA5|nr:helix-turn-helix domain-containing protein [Frankia nepalensis]